MMRTSPIANGTATHSATAVARCAQPMPEMSNSDRSVVEGPRSSHFATSSMPGMIAVRMPHSVGSTKYRTIAGALARNTMPNAMPPSVPMSCRRNDSPIAVRDSDHVPVPKTTEPMIVPTTANSSASSTAIAEIATAASTLASTTRERLVTRANVVSAVRWDHSLVTHRIARTGRRTEHGSWATEKASCRVRSLSSPSAMRRTAAASVVATMTNSSQKPARVSVILRSST
jgi:hypothetical protein